MRDLGIFVRTFERSKLTDALDAIHEHGLTVAQFNWRCAGIDTLPHHLESGIADGIRREAAARGISLVAISGTFNMIDPQRTRRLDNLAKFQVLAHSCAALGVSLITLCTGTRDTESMWKWHPDNDMSEAWSDLIESMKQVVRIASGMGVKVAFEPETGTIVNTPSRARRLLEEIDCTDVGVVLDPANLVPTAAAQTLPERLEEAFDLIGDHILLAHAKDLSDRGYVAPGLGLLGFPRYIHLLDQFAPGVPLIIHGLAEVDVGAAVSYLKRLIVESAGENT
jgi:sugar phosphate isomerase/epimerase